MAGQDKVWEAYRPVGDPDDHFDIAFWQAQGGEAIFDAAWQMAVDAYMLRTGDAQEPRLDRTVEYYGPL